MPKAKMKTKGAIPKELEVPHLMKNHIHPSSLTPNHPDEIVTPAVRAAATSSESCSNMQVDSKTSKNLKITKQKKRHNGIGKSKQLREKKTSKSNVCDGVKLLVHSERTGAPLSDSDDDKPLVSISNYKPRFFSEPQNYLPKLPTVLTSETIDTKDSAHSEPHISPVSIPAKKRKIIQREKENTSNNNECTENSGEQNADDVATQPYSYEEEIENVSTPKKMKMSPKHETDELTESCTDDRLDETDNMDSDKTEPYDYAEVSPTYTAVSPTSTHGSSGRSFSPIPSTSKDNEAFEKNELRFQESLRVDDDVEIIDVPCETIIVDDRSPEPVISETIDISVDPPPDDDIQLVSYSSPKRDPSPLNIPSISVDEILLRELDSTTDNIYNSDCEIVDVENVIAENNAILKKYKKKFPSTEVSVKAVPVAPLDLTVQPDRRESPYQLMDLDRISPFQPLSEADLFPHLTAAVPTPVEPVENPETGDPTLAGIVDTYFHNNPVTTAKTNPLSCICSTLTNILEHMSNILGNEPPQEEANSTTARKTNKHQINNYANSLAVVDTVDLDADLRYWTRPPPTAHPQVANVSVNSVLDSQIPLVAGPSNAPVQINDTLNYSRDVICQNQTPQMQPTISQTHSPEKLSDGNKKNDRRLLECPICMESLGTRPLASTICGHIFCMQCIQKATSVPGVKRCPTCRKTFTKKGQSYHALFL